MAIPPARALPLPSLPLPNPLRATEVPSFTNYSVVTRLPEIARRTIAENDFLQTTIDKIEALINEIGQGTIRPVDLPEAAFAPQWDEYIRPYLGQTWLKVPWFFAEEYFYLRILEATGYFHPGPWQGLDPYTHQKRLGLESSREPIRKLVTQVLQTAGQISPGQSEVGYPEGDDSFNDTLTRLLLADLWGNQNDLSMWPVSKIGGGGATGGGAPKGMVERANGTSAKLLSAVREHLLTDETPALLDYLGRYSPDELVVDLILDNAGYELVTDLVLTDYLLESGRVKQVTLHAKTYPVFVSDALVKDVLDTIDYLLLSAAEPVRQLAIRLRRHLLADRLRLTHHLFWTSPLAGWDMPADLADQLRDSALLITKGDANYRRLLGDRHWQMDLAFGAVVDYFPKGVLALRTLKSEIAVGIASAAVPPSDPQWMINGRWGLIEFSAP